MAKYQLPAINRPSVVTAEDEIQIEQLLFNHYGCSLYNYIEPSAFLGATETDQVNGYWGKDKFTQWTVEIQRLDGDNELCLSTVYKTYDGIFRIGAD